MNSDLPEPRLLLGPGPSPVHPRVLAAMGRPPIRAGSSEAPISATERGRTSASSDAKLAGDVAASARMAFPQPVPRSLREAEGAGKVPRRGEERGRSGRARRQLWALGESTMQPPRPRSLSHTACAAGCERPTTRAR